MPQLNAEALEALWDAGTTEVEWAQVHFGQDDWLGDSCGCPDNRCEGHHHSEGDACKCLASLLEERPDATMNVLHYRLAQTEHEYSEALQRFRQTPDDDEEAFEAYVNARMNLTFVTALHDAEAISTGGIEWPDGLETRAYLAALRKIVEHLESVVSAPSQHSNTEMTSLVGQ